MELPTPCSLIDSGLLSPVRAGSPIEEILSDDAWIDAMVKAEAGLARAQARLHMIPESAALAVTQAATTHDIDARTIAIASRQTANPVVALIAELREAVRRVDPKAVDYVHRGSTSQDIFDTASMMITRSALVQIDSNLQRVTERLAQLTVEHRGSLQVARTLGGHAVPTTFGHKCAAWKLFVDEVRQRITCLLENGLPVSLGGAAGTLAGYVENGRRSESYWANGTRNLAERLTAAYAAETGLATRPLPWHSTPTPLADIAAVCSLLAGALGKIAVDVVTLSRSEIAELEEAWEPGRGASSAMPQKRNPVLATMIRSATIQMPGLTSGLTACLSPMDERDAGAWHAQWLLLRECLRLAGGAASTSEELVLGLGVHVETMSENLKKAGGFLVAERLSAALASRMGRAEARKEIETAISAALETGEHLTEVLRKRPLIAAALSNEEIDEVMDPAGYLGIAGDDLQLPRN